MITVSIVTVIILAIIGVVCLVVAHTVPFSPPAAWVRILLLVVGWICVGIAIILLIVWLITLLTHPAPAVNVGQQLLNLL